jgi:hypothetical protein
MSGSRGQGGIIVPKIFHCGIWFSPYDAVVLDCEPFYSERFSKQVFLMAQCAICKRERRAWYGIAHDGVEDFNLHGIKAKNFQYWHQRMNISSDVHKKGALSVRVQMKWEDRYSSDMKLQRVR